MSDATGAAPSLQRLSMCDTPRVILSIDFNLRQTCRRILPVYSRHESCMRADPIPGSGRIFSALKTVYFYDFVGVAGQWRSNGSICSAAENQPELEFQFFPIFDGLNSTTLADISCVSRRFNAVAERLLYSFITIIDLLSASSPIPVKTLRCCQSILRRPHLFETIRRIQIRWQLGWQGDFQMLSPQGLAQACAEAGIVFQRLAFLEGLDIFLGPTNLVVIPSQPIHRSSTLYGVPFPIPSLLLLRGRVDERRATLHKHPIRILDTGSLIATFEAL
ncbi:hypothetical protein B0H13DRAFT_806681 [Mycena leptocephala]|nr:hypothetical protein B0H13DRAFT_806681 [Mycena leptocephala]